MDSNGLQAIGKYRSPRMDTDPSINQDGEGKLFISAHGRAPLGKEVLDLENNHFVRIKAKVGSGKNHQ